MKKRILHISTHMGGGVGKVLSGISTYAMEHDDGYEHDIMILEKPEKMQFVEICRKHNVNVKIVQGYNDISRAMAIADIVQLEWWHHPLMCALLSEFPQIPIRLIIWSHISGCYYPWIPGDFLTIPHKFVFTSQFSYDNSYWGEETKEWVKNNCAIVNSSGGFFDIGAGRKIEEKGRFCVGYMGTLSFSKLHPDYVKYCKEASSIQHIKFKITGDMDNAERIREQAEVLDIADKIDFGGYVQDVNTEFSKMDVFSYILNPKHFGTTENVLLEAMAAGLPVICLRQCAEQYLVKHNETGLFVENKEEYKRALQYLYANPKERERLGKNARRYVRDNFSVNKTMGKLNEIYDEVMCFDKRCLAFSDVFGRKPGTFFKTCLPPALSEVFPRIKEWPYILTGPSKSSLRHFQRVFPEDKELQEWCNFLP